MLACQGLLDSLSSDYDPTKQQISDDDYDLGEVLAFCHTDADDAERRNRRIRYDDGIERPSIDF